MNYGRRITAVLHKKVLSVVLLAGLTLPVWGNVFLNENFDGPLPAPIQGWAGDASVITDPFHSDVAGAGVGGTTAMVASGTFLSPGGYVAVMYQNPNITGNADATPENTKMAFDLRVNVPNIYAFTVSAQSWQGGWGGIATASIMDWTTLPYPYPGDPPWPDYQLPLEFQTITLSAADPRWGPDPYTPGFQGLFNPAGDVYQFWVQLVGGFSLPVLMGIPDFEAIALDNLRFWTVIDDLVATPAVLWSPNHKMVDVTIDYALDDGGGVAPIVSQELSVTSNEPENGLGDGDTSPDWVIVDAHHVQLRAERSGKGTGRVYTITVTAVDTLGITSTRTVTVLVPKSMGK